MNFAPAIAALRHVGSYAAGAVTVLVLVGVSQTDATALVTAANKVASGLSEVLAGLGVIVPIVMAAFAAKSSTKNAVIAAVNDTIPGVKVVAETAAATTVTVAPTPKGN